MVAPQYESRLQENMTHVEREELTQEGEAQKRTHGASPSPSEQLIEEGQAAPTTAARSELKDLPTPPQPADPLPPTRQAFALPLFCSPPQ